MAKLPQEVDSPTEIREAMTERRNKALKEDNFEDAVLFSHVIAWLAYTIEVVNERKKI